jgi:peptidoglycan/xylan/chitin deacetylase (PgdA/CDA1 family)
VIKEVLVDSPAPSREHAPGSVCLTFELDGSALWTGSFGRTSVSDRSRGDFEEIAVPRILETLDRFGARATWFVPGAIAKRYPHLVERVLEHGHELAHHGWAHEPLSDTDADNRQVLERGIAELERLSGARPRGYRVPGGNMSDSQLALLCEYDFAWDSSLQGSDFTAYFVRIGETVSAEGTVATGRITNLVEVPVSWQLDDFPAFEFVLGLNGGLRPPSQILEIWQGDFAFMRRSVPRGVFSPCFHTQVVGRGHRMLFLENLLEHISSDSGIEYETISSYSDRWRKVQ